MTFAVHSFDNYFFLILLFFCYSAGQGAKAVTSGVPRIQELLTLSKKIKTPIMTMGMCAALQKDESILGRFQNLLVDTMLEDIVESNASKVVWDPDPTCTQLEHETDQILVNLHEPFQPEWPPPEEFPHSRWVIRLQLNKEALIDRGLLPPYVARILREHMNLPNPHVPLMCSSLVVASETNMPEWILRIRVPNVANRVKYSAHDPEKRKMFERNVCWRIMYHLLRTVRIGGIVGVQSTTLRSESGKSVMDAAGSNLIGGWLIDGQDWKYTITNVVQEVQEMLGLEAAHEVLFHEFKQVMTMAGVSINDRHLMLLVDLMTRNGFLMSISRHGFNKLNAPLARASFEEMVDNLFDAAMSAEVDHMRDVVSNICVGQRTPIGTGKMHPITVDWYRDEAMLKRAEQFDEHSVIMTDITPEGLMSLDHHADYSSPLDDWDFPEIASSRPFANLLKTITLEETRTLPEIQQPEIRTDKIHTNQMDHIMVPKNVRNLSQEIDESFGSHIAGGVEFCPSSPRAKCDLDEALQFRPSSPISTRAAYSPRGLRGMPPHEQPSNPDEDITMHDSMISWETLQNVEVVQPFTDVQRQVDPMFSSLGNDDATRNSAQWDSSEMSDED